MSRTANLRRQHDAAVIVVGDIQNILGSAGGRGQAERLCLLLAKLTGLLRIHFAQEDRTLYPLMQRSSNAEAATLAERYAAEMGEIGPVYAGFAERWSSRASIEGGYDRFRREADQVFAALADRIERENTVLYPMADSIRSSEIRFTA